MKKIITLIFSLSTILSFGQALESYTVKGVVLDSNKAILPYTTVVLLSQKDSTLVNYSVSNDFGIFEMVKVKPANYIMQLSYMGYKTYSKKVSVNGLIPIVDLGVLTLVSNTSVLDELVTWH